MVQTQSLIPSFEDIKLHSADKVAGDVFDTLQNEIKSFETLANPDICDEKYLPFLAYAFKVDFWDENLDEQSKRNLIKQSLLLHRHKGTIWAVEQVLFVLNVKADVSEWFEFGGEPYYFKIKIDIWQQFPNINQLANLVDLYKNVRSKYQIDFDIETLSQYSENAKSNIAVDFFKGMDIEKKFHIVLGAENNFHSLFKSKIEVEKILEYKTSTSSSFNMETSRNFFDVNRLSDIGKQAIANIRLDFSYNGSDVMHLPIPPIILKTVVNDRAVAFFDLDFGNSNCDVFHLDFRKDYEVLGGIAIDNYSAVNMEFYESGVRLDTTSTTLFLNANSINLDI